MKFNHKIGLVALSILAASVTGCGPEASEGTTGTTGSGGGEDGSGGSASQIVTTGNGGSPAQCAGAPCTDETPDCVDHGKAYVCQCGVMLPYDQKVMCGSGGSGGSGGSSTTTTTTGNGSGGADPTTTTGAGGAPATSTTGVGGATSSTTSTMSTTTTASSASSSSSGSSGGTEPSPNWNMAATFGAPGIHAYTALCAESPSRPGGLVVSKTWSGGSITVTGEIAKGASLLCSIAYDPPAGSNVGDASYWTNQLCDPSNFAHIVAYAAATVDDKTDAAGPIDTAVPTIISNGLGGCQIKVIANPSDKIGPNDQDGDGDPVGTDCNDHAGGEHHGQIERTGGGDDNCNGFVDPAQAIGWLKVTAANFSPTWHLTATGESFPMTWQSGMGYSTKALAMRPELAESYISWPDVGNWPYCVGGICYDSSYWGGVCHEVANSVFLSRDLDSTLFPLVLKATAGTCHRYVDPAQLNP